jgi:SAM-dependent methyltransferase
MIDYSKASKTYDNTRSVDDSLIDLMAERFDFAAGRRVLDFGCGTGNYLARLSARFECELLGLEPSEAMRERARAKNPGLRIEEGDHGRIPFEDDSLDLVYMTDVIHHVSDLDLLFESLFLELKDGGLVCIATESWSQIEARWYNAYFPSLAGNEKARYPELEAIERRAEAAGLSCVAVDIAENTGPHRIDGAFIRMAEEKNYSMFRLLGEGEFEAGYSAMRRDEGRSFASPGAGTSLLWLEKGGS